MLIFSSFTSLLLCVGFIAVYFSMLQQVVNGCMRTGSPPGATTSTSAAKTTTLSTTTATLIPTTTLTTISTIPTTTTSTIPTTTTTTKPTTTTSTIPTTTTTTKQTTTTTTKPTTTTSTTTTTTTTTTSCKACTATLIFDRTQRGIAAPTKSACPVTSCPGGTNAESLPRGTAVFDVQQNAQCANPCVCDTNNICYTPFGVNNGNILVRLTTQCPTTCSTTDGCTIQALVEGTSANTKGCLAVPLTTKCSHQIGDTFSVKYVSCTGCPSTETLTCGGQVP